MGAGIRILVMRERLIRIPAWAGLLAAWLVLVAGWAVFGPNEELPPFGILLLSAMFWTPTVCRAVEVAWWRACALLATLMLATVVILPQISSLAVWLAVAVALTVPAAYWLIDRVWAPAREIRGV
jgi:hypothetical protein